MNKRFNTHWKWLTATSPPNEANARAWGVAMYLEVYGASVRGGATGGFIESDRIIRGNSVSLCACSLIRYVLIAVWCWQNGPRPGEH